MPDVPEDKRPPPVEGSGRVYFDVTDGPAAVEEILEYDLSKSYAGVVAPDGTVITHIHGFDEMTKPVCETPCAANLSVGEHRLKILKSGRQSSALLRVNAGPSAFRHTMGRYEGPNRELDTASIFLFFLGFGSVVAGGIMIPLMETKTPGVLMVAGGATAVGGAYVMAASNGSVVQPGASVHWQLPPLKF